MSAMPPPPPPITGVAEPDASDRRAGSATPTGPRAALPGTTPSPTALPGTALPGTALPDTAPSPTALPGTAPSPTALPGTAPSPTALPGTAPSHTALTGEAPSDAVPHSAARTRTASRGTTATSANRARRGRLRRALVVALIMVLALVALSGCARVRAALAVQPDDTVNGVIDIATPDGAPGGNGPQLTVPPDLSGDVDVSPYSEDGYVGSTVRFSGLTFDELSRLGAIAGPAGGRAELNLRRVGGRIAVQGRVDLTTVAVDKSDFQLKISFPGEVVDTNGEPDGGTVSWSFTPGEVGQITASVASTDPNAPSTVGWTVFLGILVLVAAAVTVLLAKRNRNPPVRV